MDEFDKYIVTEEKAGFDEFIVPSVPPKPGMLKTPVPGEPGKFRTSVGRGWEEQSWTAQMLEELTTPEVVGAMTGEIVGAPFGPPGMIAGAGIGAIVGRGSEMATDAVLNYIDSFSQKGQRPSELDAMTLPDYPEDWQGIAKELGWAGVSQAALSGIGLGVFRAMAGGLRLGHKRIFGEMLPAARQAMKTLGPWMKGKILPLLPAEATQGWLLDVAHDVAQASILGGRKIADIYKIGREKAIDDMIGAITRRIGKEASDETIGEIFVNVVRGKMTARGAATAPLWKQIDDLMGKSRVNIKPIKELLEESKALILETKGEFPAEYIKFIKRAFAKEDELSWMATRKWKSHLGRMLRETEFTIGKNDETYRMLLKTQNKLQGVMREATEEIGGDAPKLWHGVNEIYAKMSHDINRKFIRRLFAEVKEKPAVFTRRLFQKGNITTIRRTRNMMGAQSEEWGMLKRYHLEDIITRATDKKGVFKGIDFKNFLKGKGSIGKDTVEEIYSPQEFKVLSDIADALGYIESAQPKGTGAIYIQLAQAGAIPTMIYGAAQGNMLALGSGAAIWVGPSVMASAFINPKTAKIMMEGLKVPRSSPHFFTAATRMLNALKNTHKQLKKKDWEYKIKAQQTTTSIWEYVTP